MSTTSIKGRPILFSSPMVRALLEGRKTMTRRMVNPQPRQGSMGCMSKLDWSWKRKGGFSYTVSNSPNGPSDIAEDCPYGVPGDRLWVRESMRLTERGLTYAADGALVEDCAELQALMARPSLRPSVPGIHMPRWACRLVLEVTAVRVERVKEIKVADAIAEGCSEDFQETCEPCGPECSGNHYGATWEFARLWDSINGEGSWDANPWVWVVTFRRVER